MNCVKGLKNRFAFVGICFCLALLVTGPAQAANTWTAAAKITSPLGGATVSGSVSITVQISSSVSWVNYYVDNYWVASSPPYTQTWNSTMVANGLHKISINAYNSRKVLIASSTITVDVLNRVPTPTPTPAPTPTSSVIINNPTQNQIINGIFTIATTYSGPSAWENIYIDGNYYVSSPPSSFAWNTTSVIDGSHSVTAKLYNSGGLLASDSKTVIVSNSTPPPSSTPTPTPMPTPTPTPAPTPAGTFTLLPPGATLPSDTFCATAVANDTFEPRPAYSTQNNTSPSAAFITTYKAAVTGGEGGASATQLLKVTGKIIGTTDAILKGEACKWGFDEDVTRATAVNETHWKQDAIGDATNGISLGIIQVKSRDFPSTCSQVAASQNVADVNDPSCQSHLSTSFDVDYKLAYQRACMEGQISYLTARTPLAGYPTYPNGTPTEMMWGCIGQWYSGGWYDSNALVYIDQVQTILANKEWLQPGF